ncbi:phosphoribosylglycinamide formyltransferase [Vibrio sp. JC009]|uniref:phosphoribosylglycinamide formyltransferase n=1 Tax=Vibrio sp. JC009 TaxID=2912314 RepID=UPI0023B00180|nr:phosphoribosylglycinamide formyltransferase [Vibrio sp. JC009]WED21154.1 phosphoribosylglycinamide formyltransferase [Vibrio sp. JC009]
MQNIVVLISGNGTNLQAVIDACGSLITKGQVSAVFSDKAGAYGLERAKNAGIDAIVLDPKAYQSRELFDQALMTEIDTYKPDLIVLAGYMRILSDEFVRHYLGRMINVHPSLLPKYTGLNTHQRAIDAGDTVHGTSVHFVTEELDGGPVILQAEVPVFEDDTAEILNERIQSQEHRIYPMTIQWFVEGRLEMKQGKAWLDGQELGPKGYAP